jgi:hypothetical protein
MPIGVDMSIYLLNRHSHMLFEVPNIHKVWRAELWGCLITECLRRETGTVFVLCAFMYVQ